MVLREILEKREYDYLSCYAMKSAESKGRVRPEEKCDIRTEYQRDADRIIHSKAFRRLMHKTQVFLSPSKDHYRTRLTHTLEVSQIGRAIARGLCFNENLTEAIALGHDLGHTPFGHTGEAVLNEICEHGFKHNEQSLRVVDIIERERGLNLTYEVRDGILNHTSKGNAETLEGKIIQYADRIAYINHDVDDAIRAGVLSNDMLPKEYISVLGSTHSKRINNMIFNILENSENTNDIKMSEDFYNAMIGLRKFMFDNVYLSKNVKKEEDKSKGVVKTLYEYFLNNIDKLPEEYLNMLEKYGKSRVVCDYIAGMTDGYALKVFSRYFIPSGWSD